MNDEQYISPYKVREKYDVTSNTLRTWAEEGKIRYTRIREGKGKRLYNVNDIERIFGHKTPENTKIKTICYARVSSDHQREDLKRQLDILKEQYPDGEYISDIGSGINFKRKGFETLLERIHQGDVKQVVVTYKDRLCRFGIEIVEWMLKKTGTELVVLNKLTGSEKSGTDELAEDLLSITTVFVARNNGLRSGKYKRDRKEKEIKAQEKETE
jgi:predicted site-specific integrase-resolvase